MSETILFRRTGTRAHVTLNRPEVLNAVTHDMALRLEAQLHDWREDGDVAVVTIEGAGDRAFAAGGDIRALYAAGSEDGQRNFPFYADEYRINALVKHYPKPFVAFINGIVMGGGVGLSVHGSYRVVSERVTFAMPETGIGLFPDVGGSYFLPRMPGETGMYLGLTGARIGSADCLYCGVADSLIPPDSWPAAMAALDSLPPGSDRTRLDREVAARLAAHAVPPGEAPIQGRQAEIDRHFSADGLAGIFDSLAAADGEWAAAQLRALHSKSPTSLHLAFRQLRQGRELDFDDCMRMEYRLVRSCMVGHDFYEGVRAVILDKDNAPRWNPVGIGEVEEEAVAAAFAPLGADELEL